MELMRFPFLLQIFYLIVVPVVDLFLDILIHFCGNFRLFRDLVMKSSSSLDGSIIIFSELR